MVSIHRSEFEMDDRMLLVASDAEKLSGSVFNPATVLSSRSMASLVGSSDTYGWPSRRSKEADKDPFLDTPISPAGLFRPAVEGFAERFTVLQKSSQAMKHLLAKRPDSRSSFTRPKPTPTQQPVKATPPATQTALKVETRQRSRSGKRFPQPQHQGSQPRISLNLHFRHLPETRVRKGPGLAAAGPTSKLALLCPHAPHSIARAGKNVFFYHIVNVGSILAPTQPTAVIAWSVIKHKHFQKKSNLPPTTGVKPPLCGVPPQSIQPFATRVKARQAIHGVSDWVLGILSRGYTLQFYEIHQLGN